ncbi:FAD-binding oxidoreductase [Chitinophaga sp. S165]|uniref:FAD-binding oxidoreductase n=1 Tax=Chitinophaga sp. S165 TaxID=2135462 RepID=UPI000D7121EB|nr:FAD-binding oxidoreductase [Chitinophaga sp. S165]PWV54492.1 FAD/FMN-containing dehydrogenase [Chitinophaga sp. S165]
MSYKKQSSVDMMFPLKKEQVLLPGESEYNKEMQIWNGAVKYQPAMIIRPYNAKDVQSTIWLAAEKKMPLSVLGGGHDWAGRCLNDKGIVISMSKMNDIKIDPLQRVARVGGGIKAKELITAAAPYKQVAVTGTIGCVGFAGFTLGGGYGPLSPSYGLAIDNLLGAELVLADGSIVYASEATYPDLFWAIRGGGGNFGVVTSLTVRLHDEKPILSGLICYPWSEATTILKQYAEFMKSAPDQLSSLIGLLPAPDGTPMLFISPTWYGEPSEGQRVINLLKGIGTIIFEQVGPMKYGDVLAMFDQHVVIGRHTSMQTRWLGDFSEDVIEEIVIAGSERTSPFSTLNFHYFHGASTRVPLTSTPFGLRKPHFMVEILAVWEPDDVANGQRHIQWARKLSQKMAKEAFPGGYPNMLGPEEYDQIDEAYGVNLQRLREVKQQYDPGRTFNGIAIP